MFTRFRIACFPCFSHYCDDEMPEARRSSAGCTDVVRVLLGSNNSLYEVYNSIDVFLDVENAIPSPEEKLLYDRVEAVLNEAELVLADLKSYGNGGSEEVRQAIRNPDDVEVQTHAFEALSAFYERERSYYEIGQQIKAVVPDLLWFLCKGPECPAAQIEKCQALSVQLARVIDYVHRFDCARMETPALLNDLSYYRRMLTSSQYIAAPDSDYSEETYKIHSFLSDATPYLNILVGVTSNFADEIKLTSNITDTLVTFIYICRHMLDRKANLDRITPEIQDFFTRVMVGALILYDHTDPSGAFCRSSPIDIRTLVNVVKSNENHSERLLNGIRYTTKHFNDPTTPKSVRTALS
uniref:CYRIA-B_Rac1-bd domain-containing protein n=1 Tax=Panagrellus redivivus TaxID=6233 RepID=A0A7E4V5T3_PANRE